MSADLEKEHQELLQFLYSCPVGLFEVAIDGVIGMMNPFAMKLLLPLAGARMPANFFEIMEPFAPELRNMVAGFAEIRGSIFENHRIFIKPGSKETNHEAKVLACTLVKLTGTRLIATISDVSAQVAQEFRLQQAEAWFNSFLDGVESFAVLSLDAEGKINGANPSVSRQTGLSESELLGKTLAIFDVPDYVNGTLSADEQIALAGRDGWNLTENWQTGPGGEPYWCQRLIAVRNEYEGSNGPVILGYTVVFREVTRTSSDIRKLTQMLTQDYLTGASNRSHFYRVAAHEFSRSVRDGQPLSLIAIDVDHFKLVNDTYGHAAGDEVLKVFSRMCIGFLRPNDIFARVGGEEFVFLLSSMDLQSAGQLAERLRSAIAATVIDFPGGVLSVTASFGCACCNARVSTITDLLKEADRALYAAKEAGRDRVVLWTPELAGIVNE